MYHIVIGRRIFVSMNWVIIGSSSDGLPPIRRQAIALTKVDLWSIPPMASNFDEIWVSIQTFPFTKMHMKLTFANFVQFVSGSVYQLRMTTSTQSFERYASEFAFIDCNMHTLQLSGPVPQSGVWWKIWLTQQNSRFAPSHGETALLCNDVSHWLGANLESALPLSAKSTCSPFVVLGSTRRLTWSIDNATNCAKLLVRDCWVYTMHTQQGLILMIWIHLDPMDK